jgi:hypothetical protein
MGKAINYEFRSFLPTSIGSGNLNIPNKNAEFEISNGGYVDSVATFDVFGDYGGEIKEALEIGVVAHFFPQHFLQIEVKEHGQILDTIDCRGLLQTSDTTYLCSKPETKHL